MKKIPKKQNKSSCLYVFVQASKVLHVCSEAEMRDAPLRVMDHWILDDKVYEVRATPQFLVSSPSNGSVVPRLAAYVALRQDKPSPMNKMDNAQDFVRQLMMMLPANNPNPLKAVLVVVTALASLEIDPLVLGLDGALSNGFLLAPK